MTITDTRDMVLVHRVFRREFRLLPLMVRGPAARHPPGQDTSREHRSRLLPGPPRPALARRHQTPPPAHAARRRPDPNRRRNPTRQPSRQHAA